MRNYNLSHERANNLKRTTKDYGRNHHMWQYAHAINAAASESSICVDTLTENWGSNRLRIRVAIDVATRHIVRLV